MPFNLYANPAANLTMLLILVGLVGTVIPIIPGPPLIWLGMLAWAFGEQFQRVDWITLTVLGVIAIVATFSEYWLTPITQKQAGFGWKNIIAAFIGGILGGILLSGVPILGTLFGAAAGSIFGVMLITYLERRNFGQAVYAGRTYLVGCALAAFVEVSFALVMLAIFAWQAFFA
ncbi:MAG: DUF456 domain-containing protein [Anaerolineae bacterium]|nr:DUF456 domain-containing protein [Anaerolineae bacterium]